MEETGREIVTMSEQCGDGERKSPELCERSIGCHGKQSRVAGTTIALFLHMMDRKCSASSLKTLGITSTEKLLCARPLL